MQKATISDSQDDLRAEIEQFRKEVAATSNHRDRSVLQEFAEAKEAFDLAASKLEDFKKNATQGQKVLQGQIDAWTESVKNVVDKIGIHFQRLMKGNIFCPEEKSFVFFCCLAVCSLCVCHIRCLHN